MTNLTAVVTQLEQEGSRLSSELNGVEQAIQALRPLAGAAVAHVQAGEYGSRPCSLDSGIKKPGTQPNSAPQAHDIKLRAGKK